MLGAAESGSITVIAVFCISTILNAYYLMEIPARAFFFKKEREVKIKIPILRMLCLLFQTKDLV